MELLTFYVILVLGVGWWAGQWGRNGGGWGLLALLISPLLAGLGLLVVGRAMPPPVRTAPPPPRPRHDYAAAIGMLADLRERGAITDEEYTAKKTDLLARL